MSVISKYGLDTENTREGLLMAEMEAIRRGGLWKTKSGTQQGGGLLFHFLEARKLIWPHRYEHEWTRLIYDEIIKNSGTILMGSASSQKTSHASEWILIDYWCFPESTCVLVSSTTKDKLESAVFGEIKKLWGEGTNDFSWLAGHLVDHKQWIVTDDIKSSKYRDDEDDRKVVRDVRKGILGKPCYIGRQYVGLGVFCFPAGQLVDTPSGSVEIQNIKPGDEVYSAIGKSRVSAVGSRMAESLVRIHLSDGRFIDCTPEHPFLTLSGWVNAIDLYPNSKLLSWHETLHCLQAGASEKREEVLLASVPDGNMEKTVQAVRPTFHSVRGKGGFLYSLLRSEMENDTAGHCKENDSREGLGCYGQEGQQNNNGESGRTEKAQAKNDQAYTFSGPDKTPIWDWEQNAKAGNDYSGHVSRGEARYVLSDWVKLKTRAVRDILDGFCVAKIKTGCGNRRFLPQLRFAKRERSKAGCFFSAPWVVRVEVLKHPSNARPNECENGCRVYNIQVEGHPSYSVSGVVVHNSGIKQERFRFLCDELQFMSPTFMDCLPNMRSNTGAGGLKVIGSGNPNHEPTAQLTIIAEPASGWGSVEGNTTTTVWETNFTGFKCVNLIGIDSPNFRAVKAGATKEPYSRLIGPGFAKIIEHDYGLNSPEWETQVVGRMRLSLADKRVITRELCKNHGAHDEVIWDGTPTTKIHGCDPAYGRGDRCIQGHVEFGKDIKGINVLKIFPPQTIKIDLSIKGRSAEDQIALSISEYLDAHGIPASNSFYDSFGKGTIGFAFARQFGGDPPNPVDAGALPTERPVREDLFIRDERGSRLKTCKEHYSKFITEMWFSVRYAIEANQIRALPIDVMLEGCSRKYNEVAGNKIEVEPKDKMRETLGRSPDLFDWLAICVEGCRRRGFSIAKLSSGEATSTSWQWFRDMQRKSRDKWEKHELNYSV